MRKGKITENSTPAGAEPVSIKKALAKWQREKAAQEKRFGDLSKQLFAQLAALGIKKVFVYFSGGGDDGEIGKFKVRMKRKRVVPNLREIPFEGEGFLRAGRITLYGAVEDLVYGHLRIEYSAWEYESGSFGICVVDAVRRKVRDQITRKLDYDDENDEYEAVDINS